MYVYFAPCLSGFNILLVQTPSLSCMYTVQGARREGKFSTGFRIEKVAHPDGIRRQTAVQGTLLDLVEWCSFFPGMRIASKRIFTN